MKRSISISVIAIVMLLSAVSFGDPDLSGQYWFGSLSVDVDTNAPWGKRGTVSITGDQWDQEWDDKDGHNTFSSEFTTTTQPDGSINIDFSGETYNVAWNGDVMIHAGTVLNGGGEGIDILTRKATNVDVDDLVGDYSFFGHWLGTNDRWDETGWGTSYFDPNGLMGANWVSSAGYSEQDIGTWNLDDANSIVYASWGSHPLLLAKNGIHTIFRDIPDSHPDLGYNIFIKKTDQVITMADIAGIYQIRFLETGPGAVPYTCGQGTCVIEAVDDANGILMVDAYYSNGEHDVSSIDCSVGPGNEFHLDDDSVPDGIISPDKNLIFIPENRYENPPTRTDDDWLGGIFLIRMNIADLNGDGVVDYDDFVILANQWHQAPGNPSADIAPPPNGIVSIEDLMLFAQHWLDGT